MSSVTGLPNEWNLNTGYSASWSELEKKLQRAMLDTLTIYNFLCLSWEGLALFIVKNSWLEWSVVRDHRKNHLFFFFFSLIKVALVVKKPAATAGDVRDVGSIPGLRHS